MTSTTQCYPPRVPHRQAETQTRTARPATPAAQTPTPCELSAAVRPLSVRANFLWTSLGNAVQVLGQWALVVVLAHLGNLEMLGLVVLAFAVCVPVFSLFKLNLRAAVVTDARREYQFGEYLALRLTTAVPALLVIGGILLTAGHRTETALLIMLVTVTELLKSVSDIYHALLQQHERMDRIAISLMIRELATLAVLALGLYLTGNLLWGIAGFPLVAAVLLFAYDLPSAARIIKSATSDRQGNPTARTTHDTGLRPRWHAQTLFRLVKLTLPLGIVMMMLALTTSIPRFTVSYYLGNHTLGVFVSIIYLGVVGQRFVTAIGGSAGPRLAKYHVAANRTAYLRLLGKVLAPVAALGVAVVLAVALWAGPILGLLYHADYTPHRTLAVYLMMAAAVTYLTIPLGIAVEAMRRFKTHMAIRTASILVLLALLPAGIAAYGLKGAALAMLISGVCTMLGCTYVVLSAARNLEQIDHV